MLWLLQACIPMSPAGCLLTDTPRLPPSSLLPITSQTQGQGQLHQLSHGPLVGLSRDPTAWSRGCWNLYSPLGVAVRPTHSCLRAFARAVPSTQNALRQDGAPPNHCLSHSDVCPSVRKAIPACSDHFSLGHALHCPSSRLLFPPPTEYTHLFLRLCLHPTGGMSAPW